MIIEQLHIDSFGALRDRTYHFSDGVNIIEGDNESGKSTICLFIKFMFYGFSGRSGEREHGVSFADSTAKGTLVCVSDGKRYRIERAVVASGNAFRETLRTIDLDTGAPAFVKTEPGVAFFGVDADVFCNTAFIRQLGGSTVGGKALKESVENILFSANEDINTKKAIRKLDEMRVFYLHKNKKGGRLVELELAQNECAARLQKAREASAVLDNMKTSIDAARKTRDENNAIAERCRAQLSAIEELRALSQYDKTAVCREKAQEAQIRATALCRRLFHADTPPERDYVTALKLAAAELKSRQAAYAEAEQNQRDISLQAKLENPKEDLMQKIKQSGGIEPVRDGLQGLRRRQTVSLICAILFLLFGLTAGALTVMRVLFLHTLDPMHVMISAILFAVMLFFFIYRSVKNRRLTQLMQEYRCDTIDEFENFLEEYSVSEARLDLHTNQYAAAEARLKEARSAVREAAGNGASLLNELKDENTPDIDPDQLRPDHLDSIADQLQLSVRELDKLLREAEQNRALSLNITAQMEQYGTAEEIEARIVSLRTMLETEKRSDPEQLRRRLDFAVKANAALDERLTMLYEQQSTARAHAGDPQQLEETLQQLKAEYADVRKKYLAYQLALDTLSGASEQLRGTIAPKLCRAAGSVVENITAGKYAALGLDEEYQLYYTDESGTRKADFLSAGTQDLAYFGLRLALIDVLYRHETPPMLFDESFAKMDRARLARAMKALDALAKDKEHPRQTLLFTCHTREREAAEDLPDCRIIRLETV